MSSSAIPAFLVKLVNLLEDPENNDIIAWDHNGTSFHIFDQTRLAKEVLPLYFKHNNIASFIRQLNMYGFRKVLQIENAGGLKIENEDLQFSHPYFIKGHEQLLENIKRKTSGAGGNTNAAKSDEPKLSKDDVEKVLTDVSSIRSKQDQMNTKIINLKRENEALWREVATMRQKHQKQQTVVNKLISFLVTVVGSRTGMNPSMKRRHKPLMIENHPVGQGPSRAAKVPRQYDAAYDIQLPDTPDIRKPSHGGVTIQEVDVGSVTSPANSPNQPIYTFQVESPTESNSSTANSNKEFLSAEDLLEDPTVIANARENIGQTFSDLGIIDVSNNMGVSSQPVFPGMVDTASNLVSQVTTENKSEAQRKPRRSSNLKLNIPGGTGLRDISAPSPTTESENALDLLAMAVPNVKEPFTPEILDNQLENVQLNLDSIKDLLSDGYSLDANTLYGLFDPEAPVQSLPAQIFNNEDSNDGHASNSHIMGNEMIQYNNPGSVEIEDLFDFGNLSSVDSNLNKDLNSDFVDYSANDELNTPMITSLDGHSLLSLSNSEKTLQPGGINASLVKGKMEDVD